ncbi:MAG: glycosyltransferase family 1 protein [Bacteroidetes bacterium]|nr:MAG: glycosyltransferase family 1 protein [Bacteroidota bacterium]
MSEKHLHIISFDIPWPADYGGVIDVYYQIKALYNAGVKVHLHAFEYGRSHAEALNEICESVNYYPRKTGVLSNFSMTPYIIQSRKSNALVKNLLKDDYPILCQGMHTCAVLNDKRLENRKIAYRAANVEHYYYQALYHKEQNAKKMYYFMFEAWRLKKWEHHLRRADVIFTISEADEAYYKRRFPQQNVVNLFGFFEDEQFHMQEGRGDYVLYQGNLSVNENIVAVEYILDNIAAEMDMPLIVAGKNPPEELREKIEKIPNVKLVENPSHKEMQNLIQQAQVNLLITFQPTGLKLKLLNALYNGRFCIANKEMLYGSGLEPLVELAQEESEIISKIKALENSIFTQENIETRKQFLSKLYSTKDRIELMISNLF